MGSNPCRKLSLLGFAHPVEGSPFQVQGAIGKAVLTRGRVLEESRLVDLILLYNMYYNSIILICVCIKSNVLTLEPCNIYLVGIYFVSIDEEAQVAIIYSHVDPVWS